jgi:LmbE family N-acetylglucosaminyl deacetylase
MHLRERCHGARALLVSPHLDDAVYSCGELVAELQSPVVATVFAGVPPATLPLMPWDAQAGFRSGVEAMQARHREDAHALAALGAEPEHLDFLDAQYGTTPSPADVTDELRRVIRRRNPDLVLLPLGLYHDDHRLAADAALQAVRPGAAIVYEDVPYRRRPGLVQQRLCALHALGWRATPLVFEAADGRHELKRAAVRRYASQWRAFGSGGCADTDNPETYWALDTDHGH